MLHVDICFNWLLLNFTLLKGNCFLITGLTWRFPVIHKFGKLGIFVQTFNEIEVEVFTSEINLMKICIYRHA